MASLISTDELSSLLRDPTLILADIRWEAAPPDAALIAYRTGHIPGALYVDLDTDLSDRSDLSLGRHPFPAAQTFVNTLTTLGIGRDSTVVVYDDNAGSIALRLWWMLRWIGGPEARLLNGGFARWAAEGRAIETGAGKISRPSLSPIAPNPQSELLADIASVPSLPTGTILLDARTPERYRGEEETVDARAGHIPGATNAPWRGNITADPAPIYKSPAELRAQFERLGITPQTEIISSCGSGVTACHNLFALELAGFTRNRLYPGSWSEWVAKKPASPRER